jgi:type IV pilus assembly protein PilC
MLNRLADYYDEEVELATETVMAALEPMVILVLAVVVIVLVAAIMSPMLAMYQQMDSL